MGGGPAGKVNIKGSHPPSSRMMCPNEQEVRQRVKRPAWMNEELLLLLKHTRKYTGDGSRVRPLGINIERLSD